MSRFWSTVSVAIGLVCVAATQAARADIYTWVDGKGNVTLSNLSPPDGSRVTNVTHEAPQVASARNDAARDAARQAEVQALADRVRELESEVAVARYAPPPAPAAPIVAYVPVPTPVMVPYETEPASGAGRGCDPFWYGCWGWSSWGYPASVVVLPASRARRAPLVHRDRTFPPMHPVLGGGRLHFSGGLP